MNKTVRVVAILGLTALMATQFTNCGTPVQPAMVDDSSSMGCDADCVTESPSYLEVKMHLGGGGTEYSVPAGLLEFNMGGDCNEGGYPYNIVRWELHLSGIKVRDSGMLGMAGNNTVNSRCVNGRFLLYVNLKAIPSDNINRTGLLTSTGVRAPYDLYVEVLGMDSATDTSPERNTSRGRKRISLKPI